MPELTKALRVGPQSADAVPGLAAYGKGGTLPTVTDANVVLGYLPENLLCGAFKLDRPAAQAASDALGIGLMEAARGIIDIVNENMFGALRMISVQQGYDPRHSALMGFGGAGPINVNAVARLMGSYPAASPELPGVLRALGDAITRMRTETARSLSKRLSETSADEVLATLSEMAARVCARLINDGVAAAEIETGFEVDVRYSGQAFEVPMKVSLADLESDGLALLMVFDPEILFNDGYYDLIDIRIPEGSLLKPKFPAALSDRTRALGRLFDILGGLPGQKTPEFLNAAGFSSSPHLSYSGHHAKGEWFQLFQIGFGGIPGRPLGDGPDGHSLWPNFTNVPNEFIERYFPLRIERYATVPDSGGAGLHRGGDGILMTYKFLESGMIAIHDDRLFTYPWGVNGGARGARARKVLRRADCSEEIVGNKREDIALAAGDELDFIPWGSRGWGDPLERDPALVLKEMDQGLVTASGARAYGVVIENDAVDAPATTALREAMRTTRGDVIPLFNSGLSIDELRKHSLAETGLEAPRQPIWQSTGDALSIAAE